METVMYSTPGCDQTAPFVKGVETYCTTHEQARKARWNTVYGAVVAQITLGELARQHLTGQVDGVTGEKMAEFTATAREIADAALKVDP
jgi:hypothetical protein